MILDINKDHTGNALDVFCEDGLSGPINMVATQLRIQDGHLVIGFPPNIPLPAPASPLKSVRRRLRHCAALI